MSLPPVPLRSDGPELFADRGDAFLGALPAFEARMEEIDANVSARQLSATASASAASVSALAAANSATLSGASANFKGLWAGLTGALSVPASVYHASSFWVLASNTSNVTTIVPGVSPQWISVSMAYPPFNSGVI